MTDGNAIVPLTVVNNPASTCPRPAVTARGCSPSAGVALLGAAAFIVIRSRKHKNEQ